MKNDPLDLALSLYDIATPLFISLKEEFNATRDKMKTPSAPKELSFNQLRLLFGVEHGKDQVGLLAKAANVAQPAVSKSVDNLIKQNFLRRDPHPTDRRQIKLSLTPKGQAMTRRVRLKAAEKYVNAIKKLSPADHQKMVEGIAVMFDVIEQTRKEMRNGMAQ